MKKILLILAFITVFFNGFAQNPAKFKDGIDVRYIKLDTLTSTQINNLNVGTKKSAVVFNATIKAVQYWNGTSWITLGAGGAGDNWGTQVVQTDGTMQGDGTLANPLKRTGLEAVTENGKTGWRLIGMDPDNYLNTGQHAVDFSSTYMPGVGVTSDYGVSFGESNKVLQDNSSGVPGAGGYHMAFGTENTVTGYNGNMAFGTLNNITNGYSATAFGLKNSINLFATTGQGLASGLNNNLSSYWTTALGAGLISKSVGTTVVGISNTDYALSSITAVDRPLFIVGNGTASTSTNMTIYGNRLTASDAFIVKNNGLITAPSLTNSLIDTEPTGKALVSKEWIAAQGFSTGGVGSQNLQDVTDEGNHTTKIVEVQGVKFNDLRLPSTSSILGTTGILNNYIVIDNSGNVYTSNYTSKTVTKITPSGVSSVFGTTGINPTGIAIDDLGNVYTANTGSNTVTKITPDGISSVFGTTGNGPQGIAIDKLGNVYTSNQANTVTKITPSGVSSVFGTTGINPIGIAIDSDENIYTVNIGSNNVTKITQSGDSSVFGTTGDNPQSITIDLEDNIYTTSYSSNTVTKITPDGVSSVFGTTGTLPSGIKVDNLGNIYVANNGDNTVTKITPEGVSVVYGTTGSSPYGIAIDLEGNIYTSNRISNNVSKITPQTHFLTLDDNGNVITKSINDSKVPQVALDTPFTPSANIASTNVQDAIQEVRDAAGSGGGIQSVQPGTNVTIDVTDPLNPIINASGGGGSSNPNIVAITTEAQLIDPANANKILDIQSNFSLTANRTLPNGAILKDGGGRINVNGYEVTFVNNSFDFPNNRIVMDFYKDTTYEVFNYTAVGGETSLNIGKLIDTKLNYILKVNGIIRQYGVSESSGHSFTITQGATTTFNFFNVISPLTAGTAVEVLYVSSTNSSRSRINNASTFVKGDINLRCFGLVGDGNVNTNTGTDNRNVFLEATKIANITGSNLYIKGSGNFMTSLISTKDNQDEPSNWYITNGVKLYLDTKVKIGVLTVTGQTDNELISIWNSEYSLIKGGTLVGDLKTHIFQSSYDEGCHGIRLVGDSNTRYNTIDGVKLTDFVGDDIYSTFHPNFIHYNVINSASITKGYTLDNAGLPVANEDYAYSQMLSLNQFHGVNPMVVGGSSFAGFMGLTNQTYYAYYYDAAGNFLAKTGLLKFYQPVPVNSIYKQIRIVIHKPLDNWVDFDTGRTISIYAPSRPTHTTITNCDLKYAYRNGFSNLSYGSRLLYSTISYVGRKYDGTGGTLGLGGDLEDGYQNIQNVEIAYNTFTNNKAGNLTLIGSIDCSIHDNKFLYTDDPSFGSTNAVAMYQATRAQFYNNLAQGTTITLARQSEIFNSNLQDCTVLLYENKESFRDNANLTNVNLNQTTVDKFNQVSYVRNNVFKYTKLSDIPVLRNSLHWVAENNVFDFGEIAISTTSTGNGVLEYNSSIASSNNKKLSLQLQNEVAKGYFKNLVIKNIKPESGAEYDVSFKWGVVDMEDFFISTSFGINAGGVKNVMYKNGHIQGRLDIHLDYYPNTNTGLFSTLNFDNIKIEVPSELYLKFIPKASLINSGTKDVNLNFKNSHFIMHDGGWNDKWFDLKHNGTTLFENCTFESLGTSTASLASSTAGVVTFLDCDFKNTTLVPRATDKVLYTKPNANCPTFSDNTTAVAALGSGYYYKLTGTGEYEITY